MFPIIFSTLLYWLAASVNGQCYSYAGVEMDPTYKPCNGSAPASMCCHLGVMNNGGDECGLGPTYGLCGITGTQLWRESCTDRTWQSPECLQLCVGVNDTTITACPNGSYCCGRNAVDCCNANEGKFIVNNRVSDTAARVSSSSRSSQISQTTSSSSTLISVPANFVSTSISGTSQSSIVQTATAQLSTIMTTVYQPVPTSTSTNPSTNTTQPLSTAAKAGIAVGASVGIGMSLILAVLIWRLKQSKAQPHELSATETQPAMVDFNKTPKYAYRAEVDGTMPKPVETHGYGRRSEPAEML